MAASSSAGGYDHVADPDVPCGSTALNGKMRPGCTFKCCVVPLEDLTQRTRLRHVTHLSQATTDNSSSTAPYGHSRLRQLPKPTQAQESETEIDTPASKPWDHQLPLRLSSSHLLHRRSTAHAGQVSTPAHIEGHETWADAWM